MQTNDIIKIYNIYKNFKFNFDRMNQIIQKELKKKLMHSYFGRIYKMNSE